MKNHLFKILKQETSYSDKRAWDAVFKYYKSNNINEFGEVAVIPDGHFNSCTLCRHSETPIKESPCAKCKLQYGEYYK